MARCMRVFFTVAILAQGVLAQAAFGSFVGTEPAVLGVATDTVILSHRPDCGDGLQIMEDGNDKGWPCSDSAAIRGLGRGIVLVLGLCWKKRAEQFEVARCPLDLHV